ncbi:ATP-binding protein [Gephyromycinifex aptenodytis]|uniref:ATP-binding protein n=1 Tax=Gephyromycinifex aptenodytis TaxID=2716227 RepID=UPI001448203F|nr:ATP-binding protein [Gephyromycinifex aptenodytis]
MSRPPYPFAALVGQDDLKLALILTVISPELGGVLIRGEKGTAKSTAVRALAQLLPERQEVAGTPYHLSLAEYLENRGQLVPDLGDSPELVNVRVPVVELPVGATEDRVAGTLDLEAALTQGRRHLEPGLLAAAHRGILYVDEVNLLDDHVVDLLLDAAAMGVNTVEREGVSLSHPARFSLVGTMNPEEGELRPQLLDRFGLCVTVAGSSDVGERVTIMQRRARYDADPAGFASAWAEPSWAITERIAAALNRVHSVDVSDELLLRIANTSLEAGVDGHRADLTMMRAAAALAAWNGREHAQAEDVDVAAQFVLPHRMRRRPLEGIGAVTAAGGSR